MGGPGGQSAGTASYSAVKEITSDETIKDETYSSENSDENAVLATGSITAQLSDTTITKTGDSDGGDTSNFYGNNSGITAKDGAALTLENMKITTDASGANGVFSYGGSATTNNSSGDGTSVTISDSEITTTGDNAGGIMTTGGGTMTASDLTINTSGRSSAAIRTDRGGGSVDVTVGTYTTTGIGSPSVYSTADIIVSNAKLVAKASEGIVIEGKNSVTLNDCTLTDSNTELNGQSTTYKDHIPLPVDERRCRQRQCGIHGSRQQDNDEKRRHALRDKHDSDDQPGKQHYKEHRQRRQLPQSPV